MGNDSYIGVHVGNSAQIAAMDKMTDETYAFMKGEADSTSTTVHFKGKVSKMNKEDYGYYKSFMSSLGFSDSEIADYGSEYYITIKNFGNSKWLIIVGLVMFLIGGTICFIVLSKARKNADVMPVTAAPPVTQEPFVTPESLDS